MGLMEWKASVSEMKDGTYIVRMDADGHPRLSEPVAVASGYWVSTEGVSIHGKVDAKGILDALELIEPYDGETVGIWETEGITYIDRSIHIKDRGQAMRVAEACNQMAIYDCGKGEVIDL